MSPFPSKAMRWLLAASVVLVISGLTAFWSVSHQTPIKTPQAAHNTVKITIHHRACDPNEITVPAGPTTFTIRNQSQRPLEWEILDGVMVVEERENIMPGFSRTLTTKLQPGEFAMTCGLLSNPRGKLTVTHSSASDAQASHLSLINVIAALAEYRAYLTLESSDLAATIDLLLSAIETGDIKLAQSTYLDAQRIYQHIEPISEKLSAHANHIRAEPDYLSNQTADPSFSSFQHIQSLLFNSQETTTLRSWIVQLKKDTTELQVRLHSLEIQPEQLANSAMLLLEGMIEHLTHQEQEQFSNSVLANLQGAFEGTKKIAALLSPLLMNTAPNTQKEIDTQVAELDRLLSPYRQSHTVSLIEIDNQTRQQLSTVIHHLSNVLAGVNTTLGMEPMRT